MTTEINNQITTTNSNLPIFVQGELVTGIGGEQNNLTEQSGAVINQPQFLQDPRFQGIDGRGFSTVIIDTGITLNHTFFGPDNNGDGIADRIVYQEDFADRDMNATDVNGHGTNVAGIVASGNSRYPGVAPNANIIALKVFSNGGSGSFNDVERALQWVIANAANYNIASVNMSLGDGQNYQLAQQTAGIYDEIAALANAGVMVVSAAGNYFYQKNSVPGISYPAADPNGIAVGATYDTSGGAISFPGGAKAFSRVVDSITPFSQRHPSLLSIMAPGALITNAGRASSTATSTYQGTSQATPQIAGAAVLAQQLAQRELGRRLTLDEFKYLLQVSGKAIKDGDDEDDNVENTNLNFRRVNLLALGEAILNMKANGGQIRGMNYYVWSDKQEITEGNQGSLKILNFYVSRVGATNQQTTVNYSFSGLNYLQDYQQVLIRNEDGANQGTSIESNDSGVITFAPGQKLKKVSVRLIGDNDYDLNKDFYLTISNGTAPSSPGLIFNDKAKVVILNDEPVPTSNVSHSISASNLTLTEGNSGTQLLTFTVTRAGTLANSSQVTYSFGGTASYDSDYNNLGGTATPTNTTGIISFAANEVSKTITVDVLGDTESEPDETVIVSLSNPTASTGTASLNNVSASTTILDDDFTLANLEYSITSNYATLTERNSNSQTVTFTINRAGNILDSSTVYYRIDGSAAFNSDYNSIAGSSGARGLEGTVSFAASQTAKTISLRVLGDILVEDDEDIVVTLSNPSASNSNPILTNSSASLVILNDDVIPDIDYSVRTSHPTILERNSSSQTVTFTITRSGAIALASQVSFNITGSAIFNSDYNSIAGSASATSTSGIVNFNSNQTARTITLKVLGDIAVEPNENITVTLSNPTQFVGGTATLSTPSATTIITNDDVIPDIDYSVRTSHSTILEKNSSSQTVTFTITRAGAVHLASQVNFNITGSATFNSDYNSIAGSAGATSTSGIVSFNSNQTAKTITLKVLGDVGFELNENITVTLSNPTQFVGGTATLSTASATTTIINDDTPGIINGTSADDNLVGTPEDNTINSGLGNDTLTGLGGSDQFVYQNINEGVDTITDFVPGEDKIVISGLLSSIGYLGGSNAIADGYLIFESQGADTMVRIDSDGTIGPNVSQALVLVQGVVPEVLNNPANFTFNLS